MNPVDLVTIHHEGAGTPSDVARGADGGYTYWIGATRFTHLRDVWHSFATLNYNHVSLDICLSGDRDTSQVTNPDIQLIHNAFLDARKRGYVTANPTVRPHKLSPGSSTVCPGDNTMARWNDVVLACRDTQAPAPSSEDVMRVLIAAPTQPDPNQWRGAVVEFVPGKPCTMIALGGGVIAPALDPVAAKSPCQGVSTTGDGSFTIVADTPDKRNNAPYRHTVT